MIKTEQCEIWVSFYCTRIYHYLDNALKYVKETRKSIKQGGMVSIHMEIRPNR